jgi:group II intron reverse transcriptase/maturase
MLVLEPIFEADLQPEQYANRPKRSALDAVQRVHRLLKAGYTEVIDADLRGYFDAIPHAELMASIARRVSDSAMLYLIKQWLVVPVEETGNKGRTLRTTPNKDNRRGIPQGSPVSPLLSNLYMRRFVLGWKTLGHERCSQARIVNYADDYVICCKGSVQSAMEAMQHLMTRLKLTVNEEKTRLCRVPEDSVEFLGYTIGRYYSYKTGRAYIGTRPSKRSVQRVCRAVSDKTRRTRLLVETETQIEQLNRMLTGWGNYFYLGSVSEACRVVDRHTRRRLRRWLCKKHKVKGMGISRYPDSYMDQLGLICLDQVRRNYPCANA